MPPNPPPLNPPPAWKPLKGIVTPLATPLLEQDVIDQDGTRKLIEHVIDGGVTGIFLLGSTGEGPSLSHEARRNFVQFSCQIIEGRVPVLVSISDTVLSETVAMAKFAKSCGATAVVLTPPYYFTMGQLEMERYATQVLQAIPQDFPLLLYNIPFLTKSTWEVETVQKLALAHGQIVGIKDSSGDMAYFAELCQLKQTTNRPDFTVMIGPEHLLSEAIKAGGDGGVNGGSNVLPQLFVKFYQALVEAKANRVEDFPDFRVERLRTAVDEFQSIYQVADPSHHPFSRLVAGTKAALVHKGIFHHNIFVNLPLSSCESDSQMSEVGAILSGLERTKHW